MKNTNTPYVDGLARMLGDGIGLILNIAFAVVGLVSAYGAWRLWLVNGEWFIAQFDFSLTKPSFPAFLLVCLVAFVGVRMLLRRRGKAA